MVQAAHNALYLLIVFFAISLIIGGKSGGRWAWGIITKPIFALLSRLNAKIQVVVTMLVMTVLIGYGIYAAFEHASALLGHK